MDLSYLLVCIGIVGVDVGWQPRTEGGVEYLIQIEPQLLDSMKAGQVIRSDVPDYVTDIRAYQISVGNRELPRTLPAKAAGSAWQSQRLPSHAGADGGRPSSSEDRGVASASHGGDTTPGTAASRRHPSETATTGPRPLDASSEGSGGRDGSSTPVAKPWWALTWSLLALFASLGLNVYLGWILWDVHRRYQNLVRSDIQGNFGEVDSVMANAGVEHPERIGSQGS